MKRISTILKSIPNVENFRSSTGKDVPNQFKIYTKDGIFFKSYYSVIAAKLNDGTILLDRKKWDYSTTTGKYRNQFLGFDKKETEKRIELGKIKLVDLN